MAQFIGKATEYLPYGSVRIFHPPKDDPCGLQHNFCQPTEQTDDITFQFLAAETVNLIADGDFPSGSYQPTCGVVSWCGDGWTVQGNKATHIAGINNLLRQLTTFIVGNYYKLTYTISGITTNQFIVDAFANQVTSNGTYTFYKIWTNAGLLDLVFQPTTNFTGSISNVELVQVARKGDYDVDIYDIDGNMIDDVPAVNVTDTTENNVITVDYNWTNDVTVPNGCVEIKVFLDATSLFEDTFETNQGWELRGGLVIPGAANDMHFTAVGNTAANISGIFEVGVEYEVTYDVVGYANGEVRVKVGNTFGTLRFANGTYTETLLCTGTPNLTFEFFAIAGLGDLGVDNVRIRGEDNFDGLSECFDLDDSHDCTQFYVWSNNESWGSFDYSLEFEHKLRVTSRFKGSKYPTDSSIGEDSAGLKKMDFVSLRKIILLELGFAPDYIHDAIAAFFAQDNRQIEGKSYLMEDEYEPSPPNDSRVRFKDLMTSLSEIQLSNQPKLINRNE